jgi:hypothetical protein
MVSQFISSPTMFSSSLSKGKDNKRGTGDDKCLTRPGNFPEREVKQRQPQPKQCPGLAGKRDDRSFDAADQRK